MNSKTSIDSIGENGELFTTDDAVDLYTDRINDPELFPQEQKVVERYFTNTEASVLDIGCGAGRVSHLLHERGYNVTGIDISEPLVEKARSLFPEIDFCVGDARHLSFDPGTFDYVMFSYYGLDYILPKDERIRTLKEIQRVLKPAGIVVFSSHNCWSPLIPLSIRDLLQSIKDIWDFYLRERNRKRLFSRYKIESVPLGNVEIYLSNPVHQCLQLRRCKFTPLEVVGRRDGLLRFFERDPHYVAKK